ncbi:flagellar basal body-associated FliL family protein, partial [Amnimonas aquatica]
GGATPAAVSAPAPKVAKDPLYLTIDPAFVVNIRDGARYRFLQVQVDLMSRDAIVIANVEKLMPRLKGELTMLYSALDSEQVHLPEGRQALQKNTLDLLNKVLAEETGRGGVEAVYFSKFVVQ